MKNILKKFANGCLSPFNLKVMRIRNTIVSGVDLFNDLSIIINKDSPVCLDVGANEGQTIESLLKVLKNPHIYSFEPSSKTFQILQSKKFCDRVLIYNFAFGRERQKREFFNYNSSCLSSFLHLDTDNENRFRLESLENKEIVQIDTIDRFLQEKHINVVDLLKIDTQGFDLEVLLGATNALKCGVVRNVLIELNFVKMYEGQNSEEEIIHLLKENNILLIDYYEKIRQKKTLAWCTALFGRR